MSDGSALVASGSCFQGISEASGDNGYQNSSSNYPLVQLLSLCNEQTIFVPLDMMAGWSDTSFTSTALTVITPMASGFPISYAQMTVFTNGLPSDSKYLVVTGPSPAGRFVKTAPIIRPISIRNAEKFQQFHAHRDILID